MHPWKRLALLTIWLKRNRILWKFSPVVSPVFILSEISEPCFCLFEKYRFFYSLVKYLAKVFFLRFVSLSNFFSRVYPWWERNLSFLASIIYIKWQPGASITPFYWLKTVSKWLNGSCSATYSHFFLYGFSTDTSELFVFLSFKNQIRFSTTVRITGNWTWFSSDKPLTKHPPY